MSRYFQDPKKPGWLHLHRFNSVSQLLETWPDTLRVHVPDENLIAAFGIRNEALFADGTSARFDVEPDVKLERGLYLAGFRYRGKTVAVRIWVRTIPLEDW